MKTTCADAYHQYGKFDAAYGLFAEAEQGQKEWQPQHNWLYSQRGFRFCDLLLTIGGAWKEVRERAEYALNLTLNGSKNLQDIALSKLSIGRASLQETIDQSCIASNPSVSLSALEYVCCFFLVPSKIDTKIATSLNRSKEWLEGAVISLRSAGAEQFLPRGLLARAVWCRWAMVLLGQTDTITQAVQDLQETEEIAERGGMRLHLIDFHLEAARLALATSQDILSRTAAEHLAAAKKGIEETGYKRRLPEAANIEAVLSTGSPV